MSWLNQSLSNIKGQISTFASEVLSEGIIEDADPFAQLTTANNKIQELETLCANQDREIKSLRRQNAEYHNKEKLNSTASNTQADPQNAKADHSANENEDSSWFWDPPEENNAKKDPVKEENRRLLIQIEKLQTEVSDLKSKPMKHSENSSDADSLVKLLDKAREENKDLTRCLDELDSQNQQAMEKLIKLKRDLQENHEQLQRDHDNLKTKYKNSKQKVAEHSQIVETKDESLKELDDANMRLTKNLETLHQKYDRLEKVHRALKENTEKFQEENQYMSEENTRLLSNLESLSAKFDVLENSHKLLTENMEKIQEENHDLNEENFKLQEECSKLQNDLEESSKSKSSPVPVQENPVIHEKSKEPQSHPNIGSSAAHDAKAQVYIQIIENLKFEIIELQNKLNTNEEIKRLNLENVNLRKEIESLQESSKTSNISCETILDILRRRVSFDVIGVDKKVTNSHAPDDIVSYVDSCLRSFSECRNRNEKLEIRASEDSKEINQLKEKIDDINSEMYILNRDLSQCEHECSEMKKNNDFLIAEIGALKSPSKLEPILEQNEENMLILQSELEDCSNLNKSFEAELHSFKHELSQVKNERNELKKQLEEVEAQLQRSQVDAESSKTNSTIADLQKLLSDARNEVEKHKTQMCTAAAENEKYKIDLSIIDNEKVLLMKEISELKNELQSKLIICEHANKLTVENENLQRQLSTFDDLIVDYGNVKAEYDALKIKLDDLESQSYSSQNNSEQLKRTLVIKDEELQKANVSIGSMQSEVKAASETIVGLNGRLKELEERLLESSNSEMTIRTQLEKTLLEFEESKKHINEYETKYKELLAKNELIEAQFVETQRMDSHLNQERLLLEKTIQNLKDSEMKLKNSLVAMTDSKDLEMHSLNAEISELSEQINKLKVENSELASLNEDLLKYQKERNESDSSNHITKDLQVHYLELEETVKSLESEKAVLEAHLNEYDHSVKEDQVRIAEFGLLKVEMESQLEKLTSEKNELINLVTQKHNENIYYHTEIQRLNGVLFTESEKLKELHNLNLQLQNSQSQLACTNCDNLSQQLKDKEVQYADMKSALDTAMNSEVDAEKMEKMAEKNLFLAEKCELLGKNLIQEQNNNKQIVQEKNQVSKREQSLTKEVERLRRHLLEVEEAHTNELVGAEQKCQELQTNLAVAEEKAKHSSTLYTSNSIRANQEVETLRNQIKLVEKQRDDIQSHLSQSEDRNNKNLAALTNLQSVLELLQMDKNRDNEAATGRVKRDLDLSLAENQKLLSEIADLQEKLRESNNGLKAAARLSDQLDARAAQINDMKDHIGKLEEDLCLWKKKYHNVVSNQQDKVDKTLIKNMVIGFIQASTSQRREEVLKLLSTVLDFDQNETNRVGIGSKNNQDSLAQEFVRFLEKESRPTLNTVLPNLLNLGQASGTANEGSKPSSRRSSAIGSPGISQYFQSPMRSDSPHSQMSGDSPHSSASPSVNTRLVPLVPVTIDNPILANVNSSPITVNNNIPDSGASSGNAFLNTASTAFSLFTPIASTEVGINQMRNTEGAILKNVLKDT